MILDLFAGPGGWSEGLRSIGLCDVGMEWDADACRTRSAAGHTTVMADVATYPPEPFAGVVDGMIASPPCQAFSMAGTGAGRREIHHLHAAIEGCRDGWEEHGHTWEDERTPLILEPLRWVCAVRPRWLACEQVRPASPVWSHMADVLRSWGYSADTRVLCAADYGVPQTRRRAFLLASLDGVRWPEPTHAEHPEPSLFGSASKPWVTMAETLGWTETVSLDRRQNGAPVIEDAGDRPCPSVTAGAFGKGVWKLRGNNSVAGEGRAERDGGEPALTVGSRADLWRWVLVGDAQDNATVRRADQPAPTIKGGHSWGERRWVYGRQNVEGSVEVDVWEAGVLQGFPPDYPWKGAKSKAHEQIGNAVPPPWAAAIIGALTGTAP